MTIPEPDLPYTVQRKTRYSLTDYHAYGFCSIPVTASEYVSFCIPKPEKWLWTPRDRRQKKIQLHKWIMKYWNKERTRNVKKRLESLDQNEKIMTQKVHRRSTKFIECYVLELCYSPENYKYSLLKRRQRNSKINCISTSRHIRVVGLMATLV
jgi:hypothetical protein